MGFNPIRSISRGVGRTLGGVFEDLTSPFVKPIDNLLDALTPFRFKVSVDAQARLSGGTRHEIVFPNFPLAGQRTPTIGDISGGILSDLAFDTTEIRRAESELRFLSKAMRKGLYPHRDDSFYVHLRLLPSTADAVWKTDFVIEMVIKSDGQVVAESTLFMDHTRVANDLELQMDRLSKGLIDRETYRDAIMVVDTMALPAKRAMAKEFLVEVRCMDRLGKLADGFFGNFEQLSVSVERENQNYSDVLHAVECKPSTVVKTFFRIDRTEYMAEGSDKMAAINVAGSALTLAGENLNHAANILAEMGTAAPPVGDANAPGGSEAVFAYLLARTRAAEGVRDKLFQARRAIARFRSSDGPLDYRLRYKLRVENLSPDPYEVEELSFSSGPEGRDGGPVPLWNLKDFRLNRESVYETTVYPLMQYTDSLNSVTLRIKSSATNVFVRLSLVTGMGNAERVVRARKLDKRDDNTWAQKLEWSIADTALPDE